MLSLNHYNSRELMEKEQEIYANATWHGLLMGLECEEILRGKETYSYLLRTGEDRFHYYLSYVLEAPYVYKHQPFAIALSDMELGWGYQNGHTHWASKLEDLIHLIIHQPIEKCIPLLKVR